MPLTGNKAPILPGVGGGEEGPWLLGANKAV